MGDFLCFLLQQPQQSQLCCLDTPAPAAAVNWPIQQEDSDSKEKRNLGVGREDHLIADSLSGAGAFALKKKNFLFAQLDGVSQENCWYVQNWVTCVRITLRREVSCSLRCLTPSGRMVLIAIV